MVKNVPDVRVTAASGLKTTVEDPAVNAPDRVNNVPVVPVKVILEAELDTSKYLPLKYLKNQLKDCSQCLLAANPG